MVLKLNGKPLDLSPKRPAIDKMRAFLDMAPADEVFTGESFARRAGVSARNLTHDGKEILTDYTIICGNARYWGNPKAIKELRKQVGL